MVSASPMPPAVRQLIPTPAAPRTPATPSFWSRSTAPPIRTITAGSTGPGRTGATQQTTGGASPVPLETSQFSATVTVSLPGPPRTLIQPGWHVIDLPVTDPTLRSASGLVASLDAALGSATAISALAVYTAGRFVVYVPGYSSDITGLQPSQ